MSTIQELKSQMSIPFPDARVPFARDVRSVSDRAPTYTPVLLNLGLTALLLIAFVAASVMAMVVGRVLDPADSMSVGTLLAVIGGGIATISVAMRALYALVDRYDGVDTVDWRID